MAIPLDLKISYLNNTRLEMVDVSDHFEKAIIRYEYPYADGADLEDMGEKAHTLKIRCYFFDNAGQQTYDDHITLLNELKSKNDFVLIHPTYGALAVKIDSIDVRQDDRKRCAEVDIAFVEHGIEAIGPAPTNAVDAKVEAALTTNLAEITDNWLFVPKPLQALSFAHMIANAIGYLEAYMSDITQPINSLVSTINYATSIPGQILGTLDKCVERIARAYDGISSFPARFLASVNFGLATIQTSLDSFLLTDKSGAKILLMNQLTIASSRRLALETAYVYAADQAARLVQQSAGAVSTFDVMGNYSPSTPPDVVPMDVSDLENTLASSRTLLQSAISIDRTMYSLKDMALQLQTSVSAVKMTAEQVITIMVDGPTPLHVICLQYGLPYTDAYRIMALNPLLRNPNSTSGTLQIYSLAGGTA